MKDQCVTDSTLLLAETMQNGIDAAIAITAMVCVLLFFKYLIGARG